MSKYTDKRKESNKRWDSNNIKRISIALPIDAIPLLQAKASEQGLSTHKYIISCLEAQTGLKLTAESRAESKTAESDQ